MLVNWLERHKMTIMNTFSFKVNSFKWTWLSKYGKIKLGTDFVIIDKSSTVKNIINKVNIGSDFKIERNKKRKPFLIRSERTLLNRFKALWNDKYSLGNMNNKLTNKIKEAAEIIGKANGNRNNKREKTQSEHDGWKKKRT